jgi:hypothetical protein
MNLWQQNRVKKDKNKEPMRVWEGRKKDNEWKEAEREGRK